MRACIATDTDHLAHRVGDMGAFDPSVHVLFVTVILVVYSGVPGPCGQLVRASLVL